MTNEGNTRALFYEGPWYTLSNFSAFQVYWAGMLWPTSEHAYQAAKFLGTTPAIEIVLAIQAAMSPSAAKQLAHTHAGEMRPDWDDVTKLATMEDILRAKLRQHDEVKRALVCSGTREIIENSPYDSFWGRGRDWKGKNMLGRLWTKLRTEVNEKQFV